MIYNRTAADVESAKKVRLEKVQTGLPLTDEEIETLERGTMTISTINRIETKQKELKILLNGAGYFNINISVKTWGYSDIFDEENFQRLLDNLNNLKSAFFVYKDTPATPSISFDYQSINSLEKILFDLESMVTDMKGRYRQCGTFQCGEANEL